jgi:hypothetical protein
MYVLDDIHRRYVNTHVFNKNSILAIKSVAGSGKTTTLLNLAKSHSDKKILYLAFNKSLITEIKDKTKTNKITNLNPCTFDALLYDCYHSLKDIRPDIKPFNPQTIQDINPWLKGKPYRIRKDCVDEYNKFCNNPTILNIGQFTDKRLVLGLWEQTLKGELLTFESLRKLSLIQKWFRKFIDIKYDMVMIDETQDFDMLMLRMLLDDTTVPKIFVGDPKQSIYKWRGCINGFNYMPKNTLIVEFYSTFRVGNPACDTVREQFDDCWMISKSKNETHISSNIADIGGEPYTYLFRTWRLLLTTASEHPAIWINGYNAKINDIRRKHAILSKNKCAFENDEFEDDLPKFLKSITEDELELLIQNVEHNMVDETEAVCKMYTVHGYKGLEDNNIRLATDIEKIDATAKETQSVQEENMNILYVALTRGIKVIILDNIDTLNKGYQQDIRNYIVHQELSEEKYENPHNQLISPNGRILPTTGIQTKISDYFK